MGDDFGSEFLRYLFDAMYCVPQSERGLSHWVMSSEWLDDLMRITTPNGRSLWTPSFSLSAPHTLLGLPIEIRKDGGAPHLEQRQHAGA